MPLEKAEILIPVTVQRDALFRLPQQQAVISAVDVHIQDADDLARPQQAAPQRSLIALLRRHAGAARKDVKQAEQYRRQQKISDNAHLAGDAPVPREQLLHAPSPPVRSMRRATSRPSLS